MLARLTTSLAVCVSRAPKWLALDLELTQLLDRYLDSAGEVSIVSGPLLTCVASAWCACNLVGWGC